MKTTSYTKRYIFASLLVISMSIVHGQEAVPPPPSTDTIPATQDTVVRRIDVDDVEVVKAFEVKLGEAKRIGIAPVLRNREPVVKTYDYKITIVPAEIVYPDPIIKPLAMKPDAPRNVDHFYAKLGYGNLNSPYGDLSYYYGIPEKLNATIDLHHFSLDNSKKIPNQKFDESSLDLDLNYLVNENNIVGLKAYGGLEHRNFYDTTFQNNLGLKLDREMLTLGGEIYLKNAEVSPLGILYNVSMGMDYITSQSVWHEQNDIEQNYKAKIDVKKYFNKNFGLFVEGDANFTTLDIGRTNTVDLTTAQINPGVLFNAGPLDVRASADLLIENGELTPFASAEIGVQASKAIQAFVGVDQYIMQNSFMKGLERNPHLLATPKTNVNTKGQAYYGGLRGKLFNNLSFSFSGGYEKLTNMYQHRRESNLPYMTISYFDGENIFVDGNIEFNLSETSSVGATVHHNLMPQEVEEQYLNMPTFNYEAYGNIGLLNNKLRVKTAVTLKDKIRYYNVKDELVEGNTMTDISIELDYFITKNIALWVRGNNLLNNDYLRFADYPTVGIHGLGGLIVKF